jgi:hypothetical protein
MTGELKVYARMGDELQVTGSMVNMRSGPSLNDQVLIKLRRGTRVVEISRFEQWVEVTIDRDDIEVGWIHESLLTSGETTENLDDKASGHFERFMSLFEELIDKYRREDGIIHFSDVTSDVAGALQLTATDTWFKLPLERRELILSGIFGLWRDSSHNGIRLSVEVVDKNKQAHMIIFK